ncbi:DUF6504 family protein [Hyphococcus sp. DH-69]|uniref:DUF6504 family protein n=1 Tax=Hyphococcus formosus TaxID=3143534 RepID=UPI00398B7130
MRRILSLWLPQLPLDRRVRLGDSRNEGPFAIISEAKNAWRVTHLNAHARKAGVREGLSLPDARAICPDLLTEQTDTMREAGLLRALSRWADRLSPRVAIDPPDGLLLDIIGCAHLFGGEGAMGDHVRALLSDMNIYARIGIADTKIAARCLARYGENSVAIAPAGKTGDALRTLPIEGLGIDHKIGSELSRAGFRVIGQLYNVKSSELARRFGLELTKALSAAVGVTPDPIPPTAADSVYAARITLPEPIGLLSDIEAALNRLAESVCGRLKKDQKGARRFVLTMRCVDSGDRITSIGFAVPCFETGPVLQQFRHPLSMLKIEYGADWLRLIAEHIEPIRPRQVNFNDSSQEADARARLISTLGNRIGFDHVTQFVANDSHLPEREFGSVEAADNKFDRPWKYAPARRPLRLYKIPERLVSLKPGRPPRQFEWRRNAYEIKSVKGPTRITAEWWRDSDQRTRDYWTVETKNGPRFWLLTYPGDKNGKWFVAGRFP